MIINDETLKRFGYTSNDVGHFSQKILVVKCDICQFIFEKECIRVFSARKNSKSEIDLCTNIECIKKKRENTMLEKYGVINAGLSPEIRNKVKKTCLEKYGVEEAMMSPEIRKKLIKGCVDKFGVKNVFETDWCKEKSKNTMLKKYGVEWNGQSNIIKEKKKKTCLEKYGVTSYTKTKEYRDKTKKTNLKKYGVEWYAASSDRIEKTKKTCLEKYGVNNYISTDIFKQQLKKIAFKKIYDKLFFGDRLKKLYKPLFSLEEYDGVSNKEYKFECLTCNNIFLDNIDNGSLPECKICHPSITGSSKWENEINEFLSSLKQDIIRNKRRLSDKRELDIYIPSKKIAIELNGNYWHSQMSGKKLKSYHLNKTKECEILEIHLIQIFEDEWIYNKDIIKNKIRSILKINDTNKIYARKCIIKEISNEESNIFLENNHIQGSINSSPIKLGLFNDEKLISVMTFGKLRLVLGSKNIKDNEYELIRYSTNRPVIGGAEKLLSYFIKQYKPERIISYADRRWTYCKNNLYSRLGFIFKKTTAPNYWYIDKKNYLNRFHRFSFRKSILNEKLKKFDPSLTEWENMQINGYDRIWDCGSLKYEMVF